MGLKQETFIREFLAAWGDGVRDTDIDKLVNSFAEDGYWQLYIPGGPIIRGRAAMRAEIERQLSYVQRPECGIVKIVSTDDTVVTERVDHFTKNGKRAQHALMAIFELDRDGLISGWREYFDLMDLAKQTNSNPEKLSGLEA